MKKTVHYVGLDVHKETSAAAIAPTDFINPEGMKDGSPGSSGANTRGKESSLKIILPKARA